MSSRKSLFVGGIVLILGFRSVPANVTMPVIFGDHMVLQQEQTVPVWGWADPGESVTVSFGGQSVPTQATADGKWRVDLHAFPPGADPQVMTVTGKNTLTFNDVVLGDVWLASGQSNMEIPVGVCPNYAADIPQANDPLLRYFVVNQITMPDPEDGLRPAFKKTQGQWFVCTPESVIHLSGVAYAFARDLRQHLNRPIGIIQSTAYSSAAEAWTSPEAIQKNVDKDPQFQVWLDARAKVKETFPPKLDAYNKLYAQYPIDLKTWNEVTKPAFDQAHQAWNAAARQARAAGQPEPPQPTLVLRPEPPRYPDAGGIQVVGNLFNGMIAPIIPYAIKGTIWYQGNGNAGRADQYKILLPIMMSDWRARWGQGDFPFMIVQIEGFGKVYDQPCVAKDNWPLLREAQFQIATADAHSGICTPVDVSDPANLHPRDKKDPGLRMALVVRNKVYGEKIISSGPTYDSMKVEGNKIRVAFGNVGSGLTIAVPPWIAPGQVAPGTDALLGFAIAGDDRKWVWAKAQIDGNDVLVSSDQVPNPVAVRYAWANAFSGLNFYNKEGLPAFPFRTDDWPSESP